MSPSFDRLIEPPECPARALYTMEMRNITTTMPMRENLNNTSDATFRWIADSLELYATFDLGIYDNGEYFHTPTAIGTKSELSHQAGIL